MAWVDKIPWGDVEGGVRTSNGRSTGDMVQGCRLTPLHPFSSALGNGTGLPEEKTVTIAGRKESEVNMKQNMLIVRGFLVCAFATGTGVAWADTSGHTPDSPPELVGQRLQTRAGFEALVQRTQAAREEGARLSRENARRSQEVRSLDSGIASVRLSGDRILTVSSRPGTPQSATYRLAARTLEFLGPLVNESDIPTDLYIHIKDYTPHNEGVSVEGVPQCRVFPSKDAWSAAWVYCSTIHGRVPERALRQALSLL